MRSYNPKDHSIPTVQHVLQSGVAPRPIALVSSMDADGNPNLSPFSFFNAFGSNPPVIVISPAFRGHDGTPKHTFLNILETREFTVSAVSYAMVQQISLSSGDFPRSVDEFIKAGFTKLPSVLVAPPGVAESPFIMECRLRQHIDTGGKPGAGNLLVSEVVMFHVRESAFDNDKIDPRRLDLVARMGYHWYCRANGDALFELPKPKHIGIGFDALPDEIRMSSVLTGNDLALLASVSSMPAREPILSQWQDAIKSAGSEQHEPDMFEVELRVRDPEKALRYLLSDLRSGNVETTVLASRLQHCARLFLERGDIDRAWECVLMGTADGVAALRNFRI